MSALAEREGRWVLACTVDEIPSRGGRQVTIDGRDIAVFRTSQGRVHAVANRCPHRGGPLSEGIVSGDRVTCPLHGWAIDLPKGEAVAPDRGCVARFEVELRGGDVYLDVSARARDVVPVEEITGVHRTVSAERSSHVGPTLPPEQAARRVEITRGGVVLAAPTIEELWARFALRELPSYMTHLSFDLGRPVTWTAVRLREVLEALVPEIASATSLSLRSRDADLGSITRLPIVHAMDPRTVLVIGMNGRALPDEQGGPVRAVVPFAHGAKSVKWLATIELVDDC